MKRVLRKSATFRDYVDSGVVPAYTKKTKDSPPELVKNIDVAKLVYDDAIVNGINPVLLLARLHTEKSLLATHVKVAVILFSLNAAGRVDFVEIRDLSDFPGRNQLQ